MPMTSPAATPAQELSDPGPAPALAEALGPPPVQAGESAAAWRHLYGRLRAAVAPADAIEELWVRDVADLGWEALRLRRLKARFVDASSVRGLGAALARLGVDALDRDGLVADWFAGDPAAREAVAARFAAAGLDPEAIVALTLSAEIDKLERIDRLIAEVETRRAGVLREIERHRAVVAHRLRVATAEVRDAAFEDVG